jgi:uncharacterized membrane protein YeiH
MLRDLILGEVPNVLRRELYAIPALLGAGVLVAAHETGNLSPVFPILGAGLCFAERRSGAARTRGLIPQALSAPATASGGW